MKITFDPRASDDLDRIFDWIAKDNPRAAHDVIDAIETRMTRLASLGFPEIGRPGMVEGTRELVLAPFIVVYKIDNARREIVVLAIFHGAQDR
jgi:addiction module RelE/StbE family toxin